MEDTANAVLTGTLDHIDSKPNSSYLFIKNASLKLKDETKKFYFSDFLVLVQFKLPDSLSSGNLLEITGKVDSFSSPSNPGQFDEKAYYKEKNIFYKMTAVKLQTISFKTNPIKQSLFHFRDRLTLVYESCMEKKEAGIVSAMLLGNKTRLEADMKSLYQVNGIGHILAISGLHITILCTLLYRLCFLLHFPRPIPFLIAFFFLIGYGTMTGFGISTSRAVIMMLLGLIAVEIGRSYESFTAMAVSAVWILLQKPYAFFSCSFLLSYSAVLGVFLMYPALQCFLFGSLSAQEAGKRKRRRKRREIAANLKHVIGMKIRIFPVKSSNLEHVIVSLIDKYILSFPEKLFSSLLLSISIWIVTLPVILYFFYEIPTYGILLNLFVLPLVSVVVVLAILGGILGFFLPSVAKLLLFWVTQILRFYELLCRLFLKLPEPVQIFGRPSMMQIFVYYLILAVLLLLGNHLLYQQLHLNSRIAGFMKYFTIRILRIPVMLCFFLALVLLLYRKPISGLQFTMLDVGQGDGLLLQNAGKTILIDGGSSDVSKVGIYRILPYLKYYGIRRIDYMIMSHSDEDHISGQRELIEEEYTGIKIGCYLMPCLPEENRDANYQNIRKIARNAGIPIRYLNTGDYIQSGQLKLLCLHPDKDFLNESVNACSVTLSLSYGRFQMLLTGDLEKEGEELVAKRLGEVLHSGYTILKVAHHGSKNSTSQAFLSKAHPQVSLISCGKNNRYGHPHADLLQRLENCHSSVYQTPECGAIRVVMDGKKVSVSSFLKE